MTLDPETARTLGAIEAHMGNSVKTQERIELTLTSMDEKIDSVDSKADKAHTRIDKHEAKLGTVKYIAGIIGGLVAWLIK